MHFKTGPARIAHARLAVASLALGAGLFATGCQNKLHDENVQLHRQNRELQARLNEAELRSQQAPNPADLERLQGEVVARDAKIAELEQQLRTPPPGQPVDNALEGIEVTRDERAGTLTVNIPGDVLFASGEAQLKDSSKRTLDRIARAIKSDYPDRPVMVDGHSDSDPISRTRDKWKDNLDLSAERARVVGAYLASQGIDNKLLSTRALGGTAPKSTKSASRRVEIVVQMR
jgi:flagellar motor protein MotB